MWAARLARGRAELPDAHIPSISQTIHQNADGGATSSVRKKKKSRSGFGALEYTPGDETEGRKAKAGFTARIYMRIGRL